MYVFHTQQYRGLAGTPNGGSWVQIQFYYTQIGI